MLRKQASVPDRGSGTDRVGGRVFPWQCVQMRDVLRQCARRSGAETVSMQAKNGETGEMGISRARQSGLGRWLGGWDGPNRRPAHSCTPARFGGHRRLRSRAPRVSPGGNRPGNTLAADWKQLWPQLETGGETGTSARRGNRSSSGTGNLPTPFVARVVSFPCTNRRWAARATACGSRPMAPG
jgi:hypothetical protein